MGLDDQLGGVHPDLALVIKALFTSVCHLVPGTQLIYHPRSRQHVSSPNVVAFRIVPRKGLVRMRVYGHPYKFENQPDLPLKPYRYSYSECALSSPAQLSAAARYIKQAADFKRRGRRRL